MTKAAEERARHEAMGKCVAMIQDKEPKPCAKWASSFVGGVPYCGTHAGSVLNALVDAKRAAKQRAELDERISDHMAWTVTHPSVWDQRRETV